MSIETKSVFYWGFS